VKLVDQTVEIAAPPAVVYALFTDATQLVRWMAPTAEVDATTGGAIRWTHANGDSCLGEFLDLVPSRRITFTYGWDRPDVEIPPGSTTVEIQLEPLGTNGTRLRLVHRGLSDPMADAHAGGWSNYLGRLAAVAEGRDAGPDPLAGERVPAAFELGGR
jgi:uncharacterized protein YndB with AHSA1/START domain